MYVRGLCNYVNKEILSIYEIINICTAVVDESEE